MWLQRIVHNRIWFLPKENMTLQMYLYADTSGMHNRILNEIASCFLCTIYRIHNRK